MRLIFSRSIIIILQVLICVVIAQARDIMVSADSSSPMLLVYAIKTLDYLMTILHNCNEVTEMEDLLVQLINALINLSVHGKQCALSVAG